MKSTLSRLIVGSLLAPALVVGLQVIAAPNASADAPCYILTDGVTVDGELLNNVLTDATGCTGDVVLPEGITAINQIIGGPYDQFGAFQGTSVTSVVIPSTVRHIGYGAFWDMRNLRSVTFAPNSAT